MGMCFYQFVQGVRAIGLKKYKCEKENIFALFDSPPGEVEPKLL